MQTLFFDLTLFRSTEEQFLLIEDKILFASHENNLDFAQCSDFTDRTCDVDCTVILVLKHSKISWIFFTAILSDFPTEVIVLNSIIMLSCWFFMLGVLPKVAFCDFRMWSEVTFFSFRKYFLNYPFLTLGSTFLKWPFF